jgi:opacity protein-like surface antigen
MTRRSAGVASVGSVLLALCATVAAAQQPAQARIEISGGLGMLGGTELGNQDANLRANSQTAQSFRLFTTSSAFASAPLVEARVGINFSRRLGVETRFGYTRPELRTSVAADAESAPALTIVERIDQYAIDGGIIVRVDEWRFAGLTPFVTGGAGYLRQLHAGQALVEQGHGYYLGGGIRRAFVARDRHLVKTAGVRADVRLELLSGGVSFDDRLATHVGVSGSFFVGF